MSKYANVWMALSQQALDEFKDKRAVERINRDLTEDDTPAQYTGPMDDDTYNILRRMADTDNVQRGFKTVTAAGKTYTIFSLYVPGAARVQAAIDDLTAKWPTHILLLGAWWMDGRQVGTQWVLDENEQPTGVTGTPLYPIHPQTWRIMPDVVTYDIDGEETGRTSATSNADLVDVNLLVGQAPRIFT